jgi:ribosome-associated heat shock protein Hsp15
MRLDQWLWAVRVFKSRTLAAEAIKARRILVDGVAGKPASEARAGEIITIVFPDRERMLRVIGTPPARVGAKLIAQFAEEMQPPRLG